MNWNTSVIAGVGLITEIPLLGVFDLGSHIDGHVLLKSSATKDKMQKNSERAGFYDPNVPTTAPMCECANLVRRVASFAPTHSEWD